jgi:hypothetical protein
MGIEYDVIKLQHDVDESCSLSEGALQESPGDVSVKVELPEEGENIDSCRLQGGDVDKVDAWRKYPLSNHRRFWRLGYS